MVLVAPNGTKALEAVQASLEQDTPFDLITLDIMMPEMDGQDALIRIRALEQQKGIPQNQRAKVVMTSALDDSKNVLLAQEHQCDAYLVKPIRVDTFLTQLRSLGLIG